ncbi:MAG: sulfatase-like hydrolase/transferase [Thermosipho sp. (in: Bacteria)]|nr:sulfatase-like hydrolase/transferase [Thermosipho sp. (in: thermotogales)]
MKKKDNLIIITIDALRYDEFKSYFEVLEKKINRGYVFFENAFANGCGTPRSFPSIMCSSYPLAFGKQFHISKYEKTLAEALRERGYATLGFVAANPFVSSVLGYNRGFLVFDDYMRFKGNTVPGKVSWFLTTTKNLVWGKPNYPRAEEILTDVLQHLSRIDVDKSFFVWIHLMDTHLPWLPPSKNPLWKFKAVLCNIKFRNMLKEYKGKRDPNLVHNRVVKEAKKLYISTIDYLMNVLKKFMIEIDKRCPNTWIVILADHGEAFGEMGIIGHPPELFDITLHIPLVIFPPAVTIKEVVIVKDLFSLIDLSPTLLDLLQLLAEPKFFGKARNIFKYSGDNFVYSEVLEEDGSDKIDISDGHAVVSIRTNNYRYIWREKTREEELYVISNNNGVVDYKEEKLENEEVLRRMSKVVAKFRRNIVKSTIIRKFTYRKKERKY